MKISELLTESELVNELTRPPTMGKATAALERAGYEHMGSGLHASVYTKSGTDHVVKLFSYRDSAYPKFVKLAQTVSNPHFPKFKGKLMKVTEDYYAIQMEKLSPLPEQSIGYSNINISSSGLGYAINDYVRLKKGLGNNYIAPDKVKTIMEELEVSQPGIIEACDLIAGMTEAYPDIHKNNLMLRGNTLVITDPIQ